MAETVTPQAGDVWENRGELRWIQQLSSQSMWWEDAYGNNERVDETDPWFATAKRVFPPVPAQPSGEMITVECAVMHDWYGNVFITGRQGMDVAKLIEEDVSDDDRHIATVVINVPRRLTEPETLPAVQVTAETQP